jgi:hypothetical protein
MRPDGRWIEAMSKWFRQFFNRPAEAGGKDTMAEATDKAAATAGITKEDVQGLIDAAIKPVTETLKSTADALKSIGDNQKVIADTIAKLPPASSKGDDKGKAAAGADAAGKGDDKAAQALTPEQIAKIATDAATAAMNQQRESAELATRREAFVKSAESGLSKLPPVYQSRLGNDPSKWADEAKGLVGEWEAFAKANGLADKTLGGATRDGGQAGADAGATAASSLQAAATKNTPGGFLKLSAGLAPAPVATATTAATETAK